MSSLVILFFIATALFSGPTAFLFLWLTYRKFGERPLRTLAFCMLGLCFILLGNAASFIMENFLKLRDGRVAFILMNEVFLATVMTGGNLISFAHESTGTDVSQRRKNLFWTFTVIFFFVVLSLPIFLVAEGELDVARGYLASTLYGTICQAYATFLVVGKRERLAPMFRSGFPAIFVALLTLAVVSVLNDLFHFGRKTGMPDFPLSPVFFIVINVVVTVICIGQLLRSPGTTGTEAGHSAADGADSLGLTEREREIVPLILEGLTNEEIAGRLFISPHTVKNHVTNIFRKAKVESRFELLKILNSK